MFAPAVPMFRAFAAAVAVVGTVPVVAQDTAMVDDPLLNFVAGDYVVVGREPDGGATYSGSAQIELTGSRLVLKLHRGEHEITAAGGFEVPSPPGEGRVLRFRWQDVEAMIMTCLVTADLDNYARLTCYWLREGSQPSEPGLEAMFPTAAWPGRGAKPK